MDLDTVDLADPQTFLDYPLNDLWALLREQSPVHWNPPRADLPGFWAVTRYDDLIRVYRDKAHFTSTKGNVLSTLQGGGDSASGKMLAITDGTRHHSIRRLILNSFTPAVVDSVLAKVEERSRNQTSQAIQQEDVDLGAIANNLPINAIGDLLDIPQCDRTQLSEWSTLALARDGDGADVLDEVIVRTEILAYFADLLEIRRRAPGVDVISALATGIVDGTPLSDEEVIYNCYSILLSDQSVRMSAVGGALALAAHPKQ